MKKLKLFSTLLITFALFYHQANCCKDIVSKARTTSRSALIAIQRVGLTNQSVEEFKQVVQSLIERLRAKLDEDHDGRIGDQVAVQLGLIALVDTLFEYNSTPNEAQREELRDLASSDSSITGFVKSMMDKQEKPKYRSRHLFYSKIHN